MAKSRSYSPKSKRKKITHHEEKASNGTNTSLFDDDEPNPPNIPKELTDSALYVALKHLIHYTNSLLSVQAQTDITECIKIAETAQRYINAAITSITPYEPIAQYEIKKPDPNVFNSIKPLSNEPQMNLFTPESQPFNCINTQSTQCTYVDKMSQPTETTRKDLEPSHDESAIKKAIVKFEDHINAKKPAPTETQDSEWARTNFSFSSQVEHIRNTVFKYPSFRHIQLQAINAILSGRDVFVTKETGGGKSLCFQLPPLVNGGVAVIFSPLISLIKSQADQMRKIGLCCMQNVISYKDLESNLNAHKTVFWFMTPEKYVASKRTLSLLERLYAENKLCLFAIDEAHCISQWGTDFRKDYRKLGTIRKNFPHVPIMALTATSPPAVTKDILQSLHIPGAIQFHSSTGRRNLWIEVRFKTKNQIDEIVELLRDTNECAIIYCLSTMDCERVSIKLNQEGIEARPYHAKMDSESRTVNQEDWTKSRIRVIVATMAFGMGIDKADVRYVLHHSPPSSMDRYYQEIGRAGRDGLFARTILWYSHRDFERLKALVRGKKKFVEAISQVADYCYEKTKCRHKLIGEYLSQGKGEEVRVCTDTIHGCDNCAEKINLIEEDVTEEAKQIANFVEEAMEDRSKPFLTVTILVHALRGSKMKIVLKYGLDNTTGHGSLKNVNCEKIITIIQKLVSMRILEEDHRISKSFGRTVLILGKNYEDLEQGRRVTIQVPEITDNEEKEAVQDDKNEDKEAPEPKTKRKKKTSEGKSKSKKKAKRSVEVDDDTDKDLDFDFDLDEQITEIDYNDDKYDSEFNYATENPPNKVDSLIGTVDKYISDFTRDIKNQANFDSETNGHSFGINSALNKLIPGIKIKLEEPHLESVYHNNIKIPIPRKYLV